MTKWNARSTTRGTVAEACAQASRWPPPRSPERRTSSCRPTSWRVPWWSAAACSGAPQAVSGARRTSALRLAADLIREARRPVLLVGHGVVRQGAAPALRELCRQTGLHVITTFMAKRARLRRPALPLHGGAERPELPGRLLRAGRPSWSAWATTGRVGGPSAWNPDGDRRIVCHRHGDARHRRPLRTRGRASSATSATSSSSSDTCWSTRRCRPSRCPYHRAFEVALDVGDDDDTRSSRSACLRDLRELMATRRHPGVRRRRPQALGWRASGRPASPRRCSCPTVSRPWASACPGRRRRRLVVRGQKKVAAVVGDGGFLNERRRARDRQAARPSPGRADLAGRQLRPDRRCIARSSATSPARASAIPTYVALARPSACRGSGWSAPASSRPGAAAKPLPPPTGDRRRSPSTIVRERQAWGIDL